jgi:protein-tyrosine phosphatase
MSNVESFLSALAARRRFVDAREKALWRELKGFKAGDSRVTPETRSLLFDRFGVRTDVDLRSDGECRGMDGSPLGPDVRWAHVSSASYGDLQLDWGRDAFRRVFAVFLDPASAAIDFHCIAGQDRTGAVAFVVLAILGVSEEDLARDWEATALWNPFDHFNHAARYDKLVRGFDRWPGKTINERVEAYVLSLGFSPADLDAFRKRLLEPRLPRCHEDCK